MRRLLLRYPLPFCVGVVAATFLAGVALVAPRLDAIELTGAAATPPNEGRTTVTAHVAYRLVSAPGGTLRVRVVGPSAEAYQSVALGTGQGVIDVVLELGASEGELAVVAELRPAGGTGLLSKLFAGRRRAVAAVRPASLVDAARSP